MKAFTDYLVVRTDDLAYLLHLFEVSSEFPRGAYNALFNQQLETLVAQISDPPMKRLLEPALATDWTGYIAKSLRNAGFKDHDIDPLVHEIIVRLLIQPGNLFRGWSGQPIEGRFKVAVRNAVLNLVEKTRARKRNIPSISIGQEFEPGGVMPDDIAARSTPGDDEMIESFRRLVSDRLGRLALAMLDLRLEGGETKSLVGAEEFGRPSAYRIKQIVQAVKTLAREYGGEDFQTMVEKAMEREAETAGRRRVAVGKR